MHRDSSSFAVARRLLYMTAVTFNSPHLNALQNTHQHTKKGFTHLILWWWWWWRWLSFLLRGWAGNFDFVGAGKEEEEVGLTQNSLVWMLLCCGSWGKKGNLCQRIIAPLFFPFVSILNTFFPSSSVFPSLMLLFLLLLLLLSNDISFVVVVCCRLLLFSVLQHFLSLFFIN